MQEKVSRHDARLRNPLIGRDLGRIKGGITRREWAARNNLCRAASELLTQAGQGGYHQVTTYEPYPSQGYRGTHFSFANL